MITEVFPLHLHAHIDGGLHRSFTLWLRNDIDQTDLVLAVMEVMLPSTFRIVEIGHGVGMMDRCSVKMNDGRVLTVTEVDGSGPSSQTNYVID